MTVLVQFGRSGFVGRFTAPVAHARGDRVIVRSTRGIELGIVLCEPLTDTLPTEGDVLRIASPEDEARVTTFATRAGELLTVANTAATARRLPLLFIDAELTFDDRLILHGLAWDECDATPLLTHLSAQLNLVVQLLDLSRVPTTSDPQSVKGCGKPGCHSEAGGCSTCGTASETARCSSGSCARGKVPSADELTAYFAHLRQKMEASSVNRIPLH